MRQIQLVRIIFGVLLASMLAACGGGGGSSSGGGGGTTSTTIIPFKGPYSSGTVTFKDANGNLVTPVSGGTIDSNGVAVVTFNAGVTYPLIVEVTGTYYNEVTGLSETATVPLSGIILNASIAMNGPVPVTIVTETAVADLKHRLGAFSPSTPVTAASAAAALNTASALLGIPAGSVPSYNPTTHKISDADTLRLAALAVLANNQAGTTLADKAKALANQLVMLGANPATTIITQTACNSALATVTSGPLSVMETGTTAPTPATISISTYLTLYASYTPTGVAMVWDQVTWDNADWQ